MCSSNQVTVSDGGVHRDGVHGGADKIENLGNCERRITVPKRAPCKLLEMKGINKLHAFVNFPEGVVEAGNNIFGVDA